MVQLPMRDIYTVTPETDTRTHITRLGTGTEQEIRWHDSSMGHGVTVTMAW